MPPKPSKKPATKKTPKTASKAAYMKKFRAGRRSILDRTAKKAGTVRVRRQYQKSAKFMTRLIPMARLFREILEDIAGPGKGMQSSAVDALRQATEMYLVSFFEDANLCAIRERRETVQSKDMRLVRLQRVGEEGTTVPDGEDSVDDVCVRSVQIDDDNDDDDGVGAGGA